ncbi:MAG: class I SAM-dependent methyltransferase [Acidimicrobiia bacterium]|nr:class I SAM-dependent methyltransferase [Acidimicrobiia bacterium]
MDLSEAQRNWDDLGQNDPLWAICTENHRHGNQWDPEEFFATGRSAVASAMADLAGVGISVPGDGRALDFGCGFGRLTLALADHVHHVVGIDIAPSMIAGAEEHNTVGERVEYVVNAEDDLATLDDASFDLVLSIIVLQHMENLYKAAYLREFLRVLRPGGAVYVTIPSHPDLTTPLGIGFAVLPNRALNLYRKLRFGYKGLMELHGMRREEVEAVVRSAGGDVTNVRPDDSVGPAWHTFRYVITKA